MLNIMLRKSYDDLNNRIIDLSRYLDLDDISIEYKDFGTKFDDKSFIAGKTNVGNNQVYINEYIYNKKFKFANKYKLKSFRKDAHELYNDCIRTIKHELIHLYLYKKYEYLKDTEPYGVLIYSDASPLFMIYCELCEAGLSTESKEAYIYGTAMRFINFYKDNFSYKEGLYELHFFIRNEFKKEGVLEYFNAYSTFEKYKLVCKKQNNMAFEGINKAVSDKLSSWIIDIGEQFKICN